MERRREDRFDQRMACLLELNGQSHHGLVVNVSARGLLVRTRARAATASSIVARVEMPSSGAAAPLALAAVVVGQYGMPRHAPDPGASGMGLAIRSVSDAWADLLAELERRKLAQVGGGPMPLLSPSPRDGCRSCGRLRTTLWSGLCGWCAGSRPRRVIDLNVATQPLPSLTWAESTE